MVFTTLIGKAVLALLSLAGEASSLGENKREANQQLAEVHKPVPQQLFLCLLHIG